MTATTVERRGERSGNDGRRMDVQGLRAIAVIAVVVYHAGLPIPGGFVGVDIFFVISGFVITGMLSREWNTSGAIRLRRFYARRFKRLVPALAVMVTTTLVAAALILTPQGALQQQTARTALGALAFGANFAIAVATGGYFDAPAETNPLLHTWSLSVEEQFYFAFPALLIVCWRVSARARRPAVPLAVVTLTLVLSMSLAVGTAAGWQLPGLGWLPPFYNPAVRVWEFAAGALVALWAPTSRLLAAGPVNERSTLRTVGPLGVALLAASLLVVDSGRPFPGWWTLLPVAGTTLLLLEGYRTESPVSRLLAARILTRVGDWSYSIYLWHWPFIVVAAYLWPTSAWAKCAAAALSVVPALLSYAYVEQPIRHASAVTRKDWLRLVSLTTIVPIALAGSLGALSRKSIWLPAVVGAKPALSGDVGNDDYFDYLKDRAFPCAETSVRDVAPIEHRVVRCFQSKSEADVDLALVGDSHAEHLFVGFAERFPELNVAYYIQRGPVTSDSEGLQRMLDFVESSSSIRTVVVANLWSGYRFDDERMRSLLSSLRDRGKSVVVTDDVPSFSLDAFGCKYPRAFVLESKCDEGISRFETQRRGYATALDEVVAQVRGVEMVKISSLFCSAATCSMRLGNRIMFRDGNHLNIPGSRYVARSMVSRSQVLSRIDEAAASSPRIESGA